jgi:beta-galactosidase
MTQPLSHKRTAQLPTFYYGAAYYPEHWDAEDREWDARRMAKAGFNVVRMAEFAWDYMEPEEGVYRFDLFDETITRLGNRGIQTILCTPTAAPPRWLTRAHPDVLRVDANGVPMQHGSRQHACPSSPRFREYSRAITRAMAEHFAASPHVVGWQTDNELNCHFAECHCPNCQAAFREFLRRAYEGDIDALNAAWGTAFWAQTYQDVDAILTPKTGKPAFPNPAQVLDYDRFISWNITRFQHEQVEILREANPDWFVTHNGTFRHIDYRGAFTEDLDVLGVDIYPFFDPDPDHRLLSQAFNLDHARAWSGNFIVPEQQSGPGGQASYLHDTPEPREIRRMAYTSLAHGADSLLFFRWRTCRFGAEEYWCGILGHDNVPRRRYQEIQQIGEELEALGPQLLGTHVHVDVGIAAADMDVYDAHAALPLGLPSPREMAAQVHGFLLDRGYAVGCVHPADDLSDLKLYILPHWALFKPAWVPNLRAFVEGGGMLVVGARTATKDAHNNVIAATPPGPLFDLVRARVVEYGKQNAPEARPLSIQFPKAEPIATDHWYEVLEIYPGTMTVARWKGRHLDHKPAITMRRHGDGAVLYVGTYLNDDLLTVVTALSHEMQGLAPLWPEAPEGVQVVLRESEDTRLWFFINGTDTYTPVETIPEGVNAVTGNPISRLYMDRHEVRVVRESQS